MFFCFLSIILLVIIFIKKCLLVQKFETFQLLYKLIFFCFFLVVMKKLVDCLKGPEH